MCWVLPGYFFSLRFVMDTCALVNACRWRGRSNCGVTVVDSWGENSGFMVDNYWDIYIYIPIYIYTYLHIYYIQYVYIPIYILNHPGVGRRNLIFTYLHCCFLWDDFWQNGMTIFLEIDARKVGNLESRDTYFFIEQTCC